MYNQKTIISLYNSISDDKMNKEELLTILPKLYLLINKVNLDEIEIIEVIDVLKEIRDKGYIDRITPETVDFLVKITKNDFIDLSGTLYFSVILKHVILPFNEDICDKDYNLLMFCSEFETLLTQMGRMLTKEDLIILDKYNHDLKEILLVFCNTMNMYKNRVTKDVILNSMISHFASMLYFNLDKYDYEYDLIYSMVENITDSQESYDEFINYCTNLGIHKNYTRKSNDLNGIELEYVVSKDMLKYYYNNYNKKNEKSKKEVKK